MGLKIRASHGPRSPGGHFIKACSNNRETGRHFDGFNNSKIGQVTIIASTYWAPGTISFTRTFGTTYSRFTTFARDLPRFILKSTWDIPRFTLEFTKVALRLC